MKQTFKRLWMLIIPIIIVSCSGSDPKQDDDKTVEVGKSLIGKWLLSTSDSNNWLAFEFTESMRVNTEIARQGYYGNGTGFYAINKDQITGNYITDRSQTFYINWYVTEIQDLEIGLDIYEETTYIGKGELFKIVAEKELVSGNNVSPSYRDLCGTGEVSDFKSLDENIAHVDPQSGDITGVNEGITFITFNTKKGTAVIKVTVTERKKSFAELLIGTWVYDAPNENTWERYTYVEGGYLAVQWSTTVGNNVISESGQTTYSISDETVSFSLKIALGQMNMRMVTESINDFNWTYRAFNGSTLSGKFTLQHVLESKNLSPDETVIPDYQSLVGNVTIQGYKSHNESVAKVESNGTIKAVSAGRTYIDVETNKGTGVIEIEVDGGAIPIAFQTLIGQMPSKVHEVLGEIPYYEDSSIIYYKNYSPSIEMVAASLDSWTGLVKGVSVKYLSNVNVDQVTSILNATFIPFMEPTTDTFKAYMDTSERADASIGVTWDIPTLTLTYVNLATDLFQNYSVLLGMTRDEVVSKMGKNADTSNEQMQAFYFFDKKGIALVGVYYTDFVQNYNTARSVVTMFDDTLTQEEITKYLKRKYPYYPEYSSNEELVFVPEGHSMEIYYQPKEKMLMYIAVGSSTRGISGRKIVNKIKVKSKF